MFFKARRVPDTGNDSEGCFHKIQMSQWYHNVDGLTVNVDITVKLNL